MTLFGWSDYYKDDPTYETKRENEQFNSTTLSLKEGDSYVYNCYFFDLTASEGGAILFSLTKSNFLLEQCSIFNCSAQNTAGIRVTAGNCIIAFVCGQYGYAANSDAFSSICNDETRSINSVFYSSVSHCKANNYYTMFHGYGCVNIKSLNLSHNKANYTSALRCCPNQIDEETNHGSDVIYCSFSNNTAEIEQAIQMTYSGSTNKHEIKNVISLKTMQKTQYGVKEIQI